MCLHKTNRILTKSPLPTLSCLLYRRVCSLMNALEEECFCLREITINVHKLLAVLLLYVFVYFFILDFFVGCLLLNIPFYTHLNIPIIFVFLSFVYYFKNTISIFVTIFLFIYFILNRTVLQSSLSSE